MNGNNGQQLYDPYNTPHAQGLQLNLPTGALGSAAVISQRPSFCPHTAYFGGSDDGLNRVRTHSNTAAGAFYMFNTTANSTTPLANMPQRRYGYSMAMCVSGDVLVCGGEFQAEPDLATCAIYHPPNNTWAAFPSLPVAMRDFAMVILVGARNMHGALCAHLTSNPLTFL
jgi:hypothetical protein